MIRILASVLVLGLLITCGQETGDNEGGTPLIFQELETLLMGPGDNAEVVKVVPGQSMVLLVSSKARKLSLLRVTDDGFEPVREKMLYQNDPSESELTHVDVSSDGQWAVLARTIISTDEDGVQTSCGGQLVFVEAADIDSFGTILAEVDVGPMPDSVDISDDDLMVASANERDGPEAWGKCDVADAKASISILDLTGGPEAAVETMRIEMIDGDTGPREPESIVISNDNDLVVATLQDSHEAILFRVSDLMDVETPTSSSEGVNIVRLPDNIVGAAPWPDGVTNFETQAAEYFVIAGEWNDTFIVLDIDGNEVSNTEISAHDIPEGMPRVVEEGYPLFSPDSVATFARDGQLFAVFSLRHSGAVVVYDLTIPETPVYVTCTQVGKTETGGIDPDGSSIRPEGVAASSDGSFITSANEGESSVTVLVPVP